MKGKSDSGLEKQKLSYLGKRYIIIAIFLLSILIVGLIALIIEAHTNQHPVFEFLQYDIFKSDAIILGSIWLTIFFIGFSILGIAGCLFMLSNFAWKTLLLVPMTIGLTLILISFHGFYFTIDWQLKHTKYSYVGLIFITMGVIGKLATFSIKEMANKTESLESIANRVDLPFSVLLLLGNFMIIYQGIYLY